MSLRIAGIVVLGMGLALLALGAREQGFKSPSSVEARKTPDAPHPADAGSTPVLVELFTSEGCSSCPPADALLSRLLHTQPVHGTEIIPLEEHVNYWDSLGWRDPFSSDAVTARQTEYGAAFGGSEVYTPQMVVDGRAQFVGSSDSDALRAIRAASQSPKPAVQLAWSKEDALMIHVEPLTNVEQGGGQQLFLAVTENMLRSDVKRGENSGRSLEHNGVVRQLLPLGKVVSTPAGFSSTVTVHSAHEWNRTNLRAVVFVQERHSRHVLAAASVPFPS